MKWEKKKKAAATPDFELLSVLLQAVKNNSDEGIRERSIDRAIEIVERFNKETS